MPTLRAMLAAFRKNFPSFGFLIVAGPRMTASCSSFCAPADFLPKNTPILKVRGERIQQELATSTVPLTLLVDRGQVVRHAFVGSIVSRRSELVSAVERLSQVTSKVMSPGGPPMTAFVGYYDEQGVWRSVQLAKSHLTIGRADTCDIIINDPKISSLHADLYCYNAAWLIADHGSRNGVFEQQYAGGASGAAPASGRLQIGGHTLHFRFSSDAHQPTLMDATGAPVRASRQRWPLRLCRWRLSCHRARPSGPTAPSIRSEKLALQQRVAELVAALNAKQGAGQCGPRRRTGFGGERVAQRAGKRVTGAGNERTLVRKLQRAGSSAEEPGGEQSEAAVAKGKLKTLEGADGPAEASGE